MTVTGAARIFGALVGAATAASLFLPSALLTQTKRAGQQFPEVGPNFIRSYSSRSCCSVTGCSVHALRVRAVRHNRSRARSSSLSVIRFSTLRFSRENYGLARHKVLLRRSRIPADVIRFQDFDSFAIRRYIHLGIILRLFFVIYLQMNELNCGDDVITQGGLAATP